MALGDAQAEVWQTAEGLDVVACAQPHLSRAQIAYYVRTGSRFETEATNGISHFLEHMIYRGTEGHPTAHEVNFAFEELGGILYAATYVDYAVYAVSCPPESLDRTSALFGAVLTHPLFSDIDTERGIVIEEILEDHDDDGRDVDPDNASRRVLYPKHPLGYSITGTPDHVRGFQVGDLRRHHAAHYGAGNAVLAYGGAITSEQVTSLAQRDFAGIVRSERVQSAAPAAPGAEARFLYVPNRGSQTDLRVCFRAPSERSPDRAAIDMLMRLLDDGMSTRLYQTLCDEKGLCYNVSGSYDGYEDDGVIDLAASAEHGRALEVTRELLRVARELATHAPSDRELDKARNRAIWDMRGLRDSAEDLVGFHAGCILFEQPETPSSRLAENLAVTREDLRRVAESIFAPSNLYLVAVGDLKSSASLGLQNLLKNYT